MRDHRPRCRAHDPGWIGDCNCGSDPVGGTPDAADEARDRIVVSDGSPLGGKRWVNSADLRALIAGYDALLRDYADLVNDLEGSEAEVKAQAERIKTLEAERDDWRERFQQECNRGDESAGWHKVWRDRAATPPSGLGETP